jgi:hypothetical protein
MKKSYLVIILAAVVICVIIVFIHYSVSTPISLNVPAAEPVRTPAVNSGPNVEQRTGNTTASPSPASYAYLFTSQREANTSNIVGYFGYGSFAWYVPDWLVQNWTLQSSKTSQDMTFVPNQRSNATDFSDIVFTVSTSTELNNAASLYDAAVASAGPSHVAVLVNEVVLNKHSADTLKLMIGTDTRIYHTEVSDGGQIRDTYYLDGNNKTLMVTFSARADIFDQFSDHIRNMVEGIGEAKAPQG